MKLTKEQLRRIIKEELAKIDMPKWKGPPSDELSDEQKNAKRQK